MRKSDQELRATFKTTLEGDNLIFMEFFTGETEEENNARQADLVVESILLIVKEHPGKIFNFLIDLTKAGTLTYMSAHAREVYTTLPKYHMLNRAAVVGHSLMLEVTVNLLMSTAGRGSSLKWFPTREKALAWLNSE